MERITGVLNTGSRTGGFEDLEANDRALLVEQVSGEILASFEKSTIMEGKYQRKNTNGAKSIRFEHIGGIGAYYHNAGEHIQSSTIAHDKSELTLDRPLVTSFFTDDFQETMVHYNARGEYTRKMGEVLAQKYDRNIQMKLITAARLKSVLDEGDGGSVIIETDLANGDLEVRVKAFARSIIEARKELIKKNVTGQIFCITDPDTYFEIVEHRELLRDSFGGQVGNYAEGEVFKIGGVPLTYHNYLPQVDATDENNTEYYDKFHGINCTGTKAIVATAEAVGVLRGGDVTTKIWDDSGRMGSWTRASIACGMGVLRPECAVEIRSSDLPQNWDKILKTSNRIGAGRLPNP